MTGRPSRCTKLTVVPLRASASGSRAVYTRSLPSRLNTGWGDSAIVNTMSAGMRPGRSSPAVVPHHNQQRHANLRGPMGHCEESMPALRDASSALHKHHSAQRSLTLKSKLSLRFEQEAHLSQGR